MLLLLLLCISVPIIDLEGIEAWKSMAGLADEELRRLADALSSSLFHSRADSTAKKYGYAFQR